MGRSSNRWDGLAALAVAVLAIAVLPNASASPSATWSVSGMVLTHAGMPVRGANVTLVSAPCPVLPDPNGYQTCPYVASGTTDATGNFSIDIPANPGNLWAYSHPADGFGGDYDYLGAVSGPVAGVVLSVWPYRPYGNATFVLPDYSLLSSFACNGQAGRGCGTSFQVPILSWTADGATYVNSSGDLVFYSLINRTTQLLSSAWTPLHQNFMSYGGVENTEWATADGSYIYTLGCAFFCGPSSYLEFEAVNVSTGARVVHVWNVIAHSTAQNGQSDMIGLNGSYGFADLIDQNGTIHLWSLSNQTEWVGGRLAFFEANNVYWVPLLNSYIDVSAGGSSRDEVAQYRFNGTGFTLVYRGSWGNGTVSDFVNGIVYNLTAHQMYFEAGSYARGAVVTDTLLIGPNGTIASSTPLPTFGNPSWPERKWTQVTPNSPEHRIATTAWDPTIASDFSPLFFNSSWLQDPTTGTWFDTNQSMDNGGPSADNAPETVDGQFYNGTYSIDPASLYCAGTGNKNWSPNFCPLEGTFPNTTKGTIWWFWQIGQPMFPFAADAPVAQTGAPAAPSVEVASIGATAVTINWTLPNGTGGPLLNWTVFWGTEPGNYTNSSSLPPWTRSYAVPGLEAGTRYYFGVRALNHHWFGPTGSTSGVPVGRPRAPLDAPSLLAIHNLGPRPALSWKNPAGPVVNTSVYWGTSCSDLGHTASLGGVAIAFTAEAVPNGSTQWFAVAAWSSTGRSGLSNCVSDAPPAPGIATSIVLNTSTVGLYLVENVSPVFDHTVRFGPPSCASFPNERRTGNGGPWAYESGLNRSQSYCFEASSWSYGGQSPWSSPFVAPTYGDLPDPPSGVTAVPRSSGDLNVGWTNPTGPIESDSVLAGPSCFALGQVVKTPGPATSWTVGGIPNGTPEWFEVVAWGPEGASVPSECVSDAPAAPSIVSATPVGSDGVALVLSDDGLPVYNHTIRYSPVRCQAADLRWPVGTPSERTTLAGLLPSTAYCIQAASWSTGGASGFSAPVLVTTLPRGPPPAVGLRVVSTGVDDVTLSWIDPRAEVSNTTVWVEPGCAGAASQLNVSPSVEVVTLGGLSASTTYCFSVQVWNGSMGAPSSNRVSATTLDLEGSLPAAPSSHASTTVAALLVAAALTLLTISVVVPFLSGRRPGARGRAGDSRTGPSGYESSRWRRRGIWRKKTLRRGPYRR